MCTIYANVGTYMCYIYESFLCNRDSAVKDNTRASDKLCEQVSILGCILYRVICTSSSRMRVINHNWSATKQRLHPQSVAEISRRSVLSGDRI